jgi:hypothetical protein
VNDDELLWHYTGVAGLRGIVEGKAIRATHYRYLNDTSEFVLAF